MTIVVIMRKRWRGKESLQRSKKEVDAGEDTNNDDEEIRGDVYKDA